MKKLSAVILSVSLLANCSSKKEEPSTIENKSPIDQKLDDYKSALSEKILTLQGDGDYNGVAQLVSEKGVIGEALQAELDRLADQNIPVDIVFKQGVEVLRLK